MASGAGSTRPSSAMMSASGSARVESSRVTTPLMATRPSRTRRSAPRRELSPAWARILLSLSLAMALAADDRLGGAEVGDHQLAVHPGQIADVAQAEGDQELARRLVQEGAARRLLATGHADEPALEEIVEDRVGAHATHGVQLGLRHGLLVGDDGQRLQRRSRQPHARTRAGQ